MSTPMTRMIRHRTPVLATQVRQVQKQLPNLYDYLRLRDRAFERTFARIPSRVEIERSSVFNSRQGGDIDQTFQKFAASQDEFDRWFKQPVPAASDADFNIPPAERMSEILSDYEA